MGGELVRKCCLFPVRELLERRPVHPTQQLSMYRRLERGMLSDAHMQSIVLLPWLMCARNIFLSAFANNSFVYAFVSFPVATGTGPQHCKCNSGWQGSTCSEAICEVCDLNHGACTAPETCECKDPSKWKGTACDLPICSVCTNGNCTAPATCTCQEGGEVPSAYLTSPRSSIAGGSAPGGRWFESEPPIQVQMHISRKANAIETPVRAATARARPVLCNIAPG